MAQHLASTALTPQISRKFGAGINVLGIGLPLGNRIQFDTQLGRGSPDFEKPIRERQRLLRRLRRCTRNEGPARNDQILLLLAFEKEVGRAPPVRETITLNVDRAQFVFAGFTS